MNCRPRFSLMLLVLSGLASGAAAEGPDELWEMTMKMEMAGMPGMPGQTSQVCKPKGDRDPARMGEQDKNSDCKVSDVKTSGNKTTWKMTCTRPEPMTGTGEMTHAGDKFNGTIKMRGKMDGEAFDMTQVLSGKRVGTCKYEDPSKKANEMMAQHNAMIAEECNKQIEALNPLMVFGGQGLPQESLMCRDRKADYCAQTAKVGKQMRSAGAAYAEGNRKYPQWRESMQACGTDPASVSGPVCKAGADKKDWTFVSENCPTESRALAMKHCAGMDYTTAMASEYREICQRHGSDLAKEKVASPAAQGGATEKKQNATVDAVKESAKSLKKLLKF